MCRSAYARRVGGRTVAKLRKHDLGVVSGLCPDIVILEIGTNDLALSKPEVVSSEIEELVRLLLDQYFVRVVVLCHVSPRAHSHSQVIKSDFNTKAALLNQYTRVVLEHVSPVSCWTHRGFSNPSVSPFLPDGVHFNHTGQFALYRSYRRAILTALRMLLHVISPHSKFQGEKFTPS